MTDTNRVFDIGAASDRLDAAIKEMLTIIDGGLASCSNRENVSAVEMQDRFLDLRFIVAPGEKGGLSLYEDATPEETG